jgi:hypothetical protein
LRAPVGLFAASRDALIFLDQELLHQRKLFKQIAWIAIRLRRRWLEYTQRTIWFIRWVRPASLISRTGKPHRISPMLHANREYDELSTWAA